jgi:putative addiction module component (TIGR02574 family)
MAVPSRQEIEQLSVDARIRLIEEIWNSLCETPDALPLTDAQRDELDRRLAQDAADPSAGETWEEVRERLRNKT